MTNNTMAFIYKRMAIAGRSGHSLKYNKSVAQGTQHSAYIYTFALRHCMTSDIGILCVIVLLH